ncbi:Vacuolar ATP synthase subunit C [Puccinia graminis f. sp. tritici]|uniref:V-type proton ATPase subunit C n=1 Tax=Puccinia graminis f. sp. tritici TaxID=56615 RepID=A0A5B0Q7H8_PUCGR|nr:Vacuolar ATP synthase subunit C [Puccinia graminis f. sp. tritici]
MLVTFPVVIHCCLPTKGLLQPPTIFLTKLLTAKIKPLMPNPDSFWMVSFRPDSEETVSELSEKLTGITTINDSISAPFAHLVLPEFKVPPLSTLINLSENLSKTESLTNQTLQKIVETLKLLANSKPAAFARKKTNNSNSGGQAGEDDNLIMEDGRSYETYLFKNWEWNRGKYNRVENRTLEDLVEVLVKEVTLIDNSHKLKLASYNQAKAQASASLRKRTGNLSVKSLADVVTKENFVSTDSEFLETLLVAVPNNHVKEWNNSYERLTPLVVPRSSTKIAQDEDYTLFNVTVFKKIKEEYSQKCREKKFIVRDFVYDESEIEKSRTQQKEYEQHEKELWSELLRLSRINFSETFQVIVHLKVIQTYIESLLRYGLPAHYCTIVIKPEPKNLKKILHQLSSFYNSLESNTNGSTKNQKTKLDKHVNDQDELVGGEYASVLEKEVFDFVLFEIFDPKRNSKDH